MVSLLCVRQEIVKRKFQYYNYQNEIENWKFQNWKSENSKLETFLPPKYSKVQVGSEKF